jgi:hypothetical protein
MSKIQALVKHQPRDSLENRANYSLKKMTTFLTSYNKNIKAKNFLSTTKQQSVLKASTLQQNCLCTVKMSLMRQKYLREKYRTIKRPPKIGLKIAVDQLRE